MSAPDQQATAGGATQAYPLYLTREQAVSHNGPTPVVSISSKDPDYYIWGRNCQVLQMSEEDVRKVIGDHVEFVPGVTPQDCDMFWEGYVNAQVVRPEGFAQ